MGCNTPIRIGSWAWPVAAVPSKATAATANVADLSATGMDPFSFVSDFRPAPAGC
jgi:hypothetical protein